MQNDWGQVMTVTRDQAGEIGPVETDRHCMPEFLEDQRVQGEAFCADCPDSEACATGWPCWKVRLVASCR